jgi:hypothetical protein
MIASAPLAMLAHQGRKAQLPYAPQAQRFRGSSFSCIGGSLVRLRRSGSLGDDPFTLPTIEQGLTGSIPVRATIRIRLPAQLPRGTV